MPEDVDGDGRMDVVVLPGDPVPVLRGASPRTLTAVYGDDEDWPELAIEKRMQQNFGFVAGHVDLPSSATHASRSNERARAKRDITVPTGTPTTSAISR